MEIQNSKILNLLNYTLWAFQQKKNVSQDYKSIFKVKKHYDMLNAFCKEAEKFKGLIKIRIFFIISLLQLDMEKIL